MRSGPEKAVELSTYLFKWRSDARRKMKNVAGAAISEKTKREGTDTSSKNKRGMWDDLPKTAGRIRNVPQAQLFGTFGCRVRAARIGGKPARFFLSEGKILPSPCAFRSQNGSTEESKKNAVHLRLLRRTLPSRMKHRVGKTHPAYRRTIRKIRTKRNSLQKNKTNRMRRYIRITDAEQRRLIDALMRLLVYKSFNKVICDVLYLGAFSL